MRLQSHDPVSRGQPSPFTDGYWEGLSVDLGIMERTWKLLYIISRLGFGAFLPDPSCMRTFRSTILCKACYVVAAASHKSLKIGKNYVYRCCYDASIIVVEYTRTPSSRYVVGPYMTIPRPPPILPASMSFSMFSSNNFSIILKYLGSSTLSLQSKS